MTLYIGNIILLFEWKMLKSTKIALTRSGDYIDIIVAIHLQLVNTYNQCCHHCWQEPVCQSRDMPVVMVTSTYLQLIVLSYLNTLFVV